MRGCGQSVPLQFRRLHHLSEHRFCQLIVVRLDDKAKLEQPPFQAVLRSSARAISRWSLRLLDTVMITGRVHLATAPRQGLWPAFVNAVDNVTGYQSVQSDGHDSRDPVTTGSSKDRTRVHLALEEVTILYTPSRIQGRGRRVALWLCEDARMHGGGDDRLYLPSPMMTARLAVSLDIIATLCRE